MLTSLELQGAPGVFQTLVHTIFRKLIYKFVIVLYMIFLLIVNLMKIIKTVKNRTR